MKERIWRGILGSLYKVEGGRVYVYRNISKSWVVSRYGSDLAFFNEGIKQGYLKEVK